jgi:diguanylate cyclase (GGDEF)-like protein
MAQDRTDKTSAPGGAAASLGVERAGMLAQIVELAAEALPGAEQASVSVFTPQGLATVAASGPLAHQVDELQYRAGEGPCVAAAHQGTVVLVPDLRIETRWPEFTSRLAGHSGVRSMLSLPVRTSSGVAGSLNVSAATAGAFDMVTGRIASALAALAGLAIGAAAQADRAADRVAQLESVFALLVHDLRSGLTVARTAEDFLTGQRDRLDPDGQEALGLLGDELGRQERLLTELVDLVRAELPATRAAPLLPQVQQAVREHRHPVPVRSDPGAAGALVRMHPVRLRRILANLLANADRHAGGATAVYVTCTGQRVEVTVEDAGPGVPSGHRESVFTRLLPSAASPGEQGSHLGLALCRLHTRLAGGDLRVEDRPGGGARFVLLLPTAAAPGTGDRGAAQAPSTGPPLGEAAEAGESVESAESAEHRLAQRLTTVARALLDEPEMTQSLQRLVEVAATNLGPQIYASVSLMHQRGPAYTAATSDERALRADQLQYELGEGPCLEAIGEQDTISVEDLTADARHPGWSRRAAEETGIRSALSLPLGTGGSAGNLGSLNLYSPRQHAFDAETRAAGLALAAQAAIAARGAQTEEQLRAAITTRTVIRQAQGILMERLKTTPDQAFAILSRTSSNTNIKLREIARQLAETGELPTTDLRGDRLPATPSLDERTLQLHAMTRDEAAKAWRDAEAAHRSLTERGSDSPHARQLLELASLRVQIAGDRYAAAVDRLAAAVTLRRAGVDKITGALSRDFGMDALRHEVHRAQRQNTKLAIAFLDVDGLKAINDSRGHASGDAALATVGSQARQRVRDYDLFVRVGGDEFILAFPDATVVHARSRLAEIQAALARHIPPLTVSFGVVELAAGEHLEHLIERADAEMYRHRSRARSQPPKPRPAT